MHVVLLTNDLMVSSRVEGAAQRVGATIKSVSAIDGSTWQRGVPPMVDVVIVDLSTPSLEIGNVVGQIKSVGEPVPKIVAFGPHVHESLLAAARDAGCDQVVSRGQFFAQLDALLIQAAAH